MKKGSFDTNVGLSFGKIKYPDFANTYIVEWLK